MSLSERDARALLLATRIGYICRDIRLQQCMTIAELSEKSGLPERTLRTLERGEGIHQTLDVMAIVAWGLGFEWEFSAKDARNKYIASGMEAGTGETEGLDPKDDSPVGSEASETPDLQSADAPNVSRNLSPSNSRKV